MGSLDQDSFGIRFDPPISKFIPHRDCEWPRRALCGRDPVEFSMGSRPSFDHLLFPHGVLPPIGVDYTHGDRIFETYAVFSDIRETLLQQICPISGRGKEAMKNSAR